MNNDHPVAGQWPGVARVWPLLGPPLRPSGEDVALLRAALARYGPGKHALRVLILGVTPEFADLPWPAGSRVEALDKTPEMIRYVWPGDSALAHLGDWLRMPWDSPTFDVVLCDGGLQLLPYPQGLQTLAQELRRVLKPGGLCLFRLFAPAAVTRSPADVVRALLDGKIADLNELKLQILLAMQPEPSRGVMLDAVWQYLHQHLGDWETLALRLGWDLPHLRAIDAYRGSSAVYHFFPVEQLREFFSPAKGFEFLEVATGSYPMALHCPVLTLRLSAKVAGSE